MTVDERIGALLKQSEEQGRTIDRILVALDKVSANFLEFQEDRHQMNLTMQSLIEKVDRITGFFERSLVVPPNGKAKNGKKKKGE